MKKLKIWVLQTGEPVHTDGGNPRPMRAMNLTNALTAAGHDVVLWTSTFYHQEKCQRTITDGRAKVSALLEIRFIDSPGYQTNIGIRRLVDHWILGSNLKKELQNESEPPDVAFIGYPPIECAVVMGKWLQKHNVPYLLDVKDLWPSVFVEALPKFLQPVGRIALEPYFRLAKWCMTNAAGISAMAESFLINVLSMTSRKRCSTDGVFYLTSQKQVESSEFLSEACAWWDQLDVHQDDGKFRICYVGNLSPNVDLEPIRLAAMYFEQANPLVEFVICGNGVSLESFKHSMRGLNNVIFPGRIDRSKIEILAQRSRAALIPYVNSENFKLSLPNKSIDSMSLGLPILSPLQGEVAGLIEKFDVGMRYGNDTDLTISNCIEKLITDPILQRRMADNALSLYDKEFSYRAVYGGLVGHLEMLSGMKLGRLNG